MSVMEKSDEMAWVGDDALVDPSHIIRAETSDLIKPHFWATTLLFAMLGLLIFVMENPENYYVATEYYIFTVLMWSALFYYSFSTGKHPLRLNTDNGSINTGYDSESRFSLGEIESISIHRYYFAPWKNVVIKRKNWQGTHIYYGLENPEEIVEEILNRSKAPIQVKRKSFFLPVQHPVFFMLIHFPVLLNFMFPHKLAEIIF